MSQKADIDGGGGAIIDVTSLVRIRVCCKMPGSSLLDVNPMEDSLLQIPKKAFNCCPVCSNWLVHELR